MNYSENTMDALSIFYHEFIKYSGGDGSGLGIVLTPQHLTEFMVEVAGVKANSKVADICCGSGSFLVSAMVKMFREARVDDYDNIRNNQLYGVELDNDLFTLAIANMIVRGDGKSNIVHGDCFDKEIIENLKLKNIDIGLINPPYSQADHCELEFTENLLNILSSRGTACVVVPMSCAIGTKFKEVRERLFKKHTLKAVFSMPDDIFYPTGTNVCVMVWEAHRPHNSEVSTFFGYYKNDGFVKAKKKGRIDKFDKWDGIKKEWIRLYNEKEEKSEFSVKRCVNWNDEWLCEAYIKTDFEKLRQEDFERSVRNYLSFLVKNGVNDEEQF
jgi:type I restriction-modification system DNA methylase subunit